MTWPEQLHVTRMPPGSSSETPRRFNQWYARRASSTALRLRANLGGSRITPPNRSPASSSDSQRLETVPFLESHVLQAVPLHVGPGEHDGPLAGVDAQDLAGAADGRGGHAESAAVAEHVQHAAIAEIAGGRHAVLALIEIEARLLPLGQIDFVSQPVIDDHQRPVGQCRAGDSPISADTEIGTVPSKGRRAGRCPRCG